ncbi:hypothetical protein [Streptomyces sp. NPDC096311]|uniref:hypothetical protein n=1 Tax=Streptomyces sp. NPDC096311 TaxID=3366083 RepID=UPI0038017070
MSVTGVRAVGAMPDDKVWDLMPGRGSADEDAFRLSSFLDACRDDSEHVEALRDADRDQFPSHGEKGLFVAVARKASPFSALAYALGPDAVPPTSSSTARCVCCATPPVPPGPRPPTSAGTDGAEHPHAP